MESLTIRISAEDKELLKNYANLKSISMSDLLRQSALDLIETEIDLQLYKRAEKIISKNEPTISFEQAIKDLGLENEI